MKNEEINRPLKVALISTTSHGQHDKSVKAIDFFKTSPWFRGNLKYSEELGCTQIYILSTEDGLLSPDKLISGYYAQDINNITGKRYKEYLINLAEQIRSQIPKGSTLFFFANNKFRKVIKLLGSNYVIREPMAGMDRHIQMHFYKQKGYTAHDI